MADCPEESEEITTLCNGLLLNTGILNPDKLSAMLKSGKTANQLKRPVLLDPVGAGASKWRTQAIQELLKEIHFDAVRGNLSEIKALFCQGTHSHGVDADNADCITKENFLEMAKLIQTIAVQQNTIIAVTSQIDIIADNAKIYCIQNGCSMMKSVTGSGCQLSALAAAFLTANPDKPLEAVASAVCAMGVCGEIAFSHLTAEEGNASYRNKIIDAVYHLTPEILDNMANFKILQKEAISL